MPDRKTPFSHSLSRRVAFYGMILLTTCSFMLTVIWFDQVAVRLRQVRWEFVPISVRYWLWIVESAVLYPVITVAWVCATFGFIPGLSRRSATPLFAVALLIILASVMIYAIAIWRLQAHSPFPIGPTQTTTFVGHEAFLGLVVICLIAMTPFFGLASLRMLGRRSSGKTDFDES